MPKKLPPNFDAQRYLAAYPDVALSGLDPATHYLRFGSLMGRSPMGKDVAGGSTPQPLKATSKPEKPASIPPKPRAAKPSPIIDRPVDFDPVKVIATPAPPRQNADGDGTIRLETLGLSQFMSAKEQPRLCACLAAYASMMELPLPAGFNVAPQLSIDEFAVGETRIENAWYAGESRLRLMIAGGKGADATSKGWVLRAYQALPASPDALREAGQGVQFPASGPIFHDVELVHPLMPVVLELSDADGITRGLALLPYPSLLPGGMHGAELKALQSEPSPMDTFWSLSEQYLREHVGEPDWPGRSITQVSWSDGRPSVSDQLQEWMTVIFRLPTDGPNSPSGLDLSLPADCVPTISALVSRRVELADDSAAIPPFLVVEPSSWRPRWSVTLPAGKEPDPRLPVISSGHGAASSSPSAGAIPIHAAIALRSADQLDELADGPPPANTSEVPLTVILDASDLGRVEALAKMLREGAADRDVELLVRSEDFDDVLSGALSRVCGKEGWAATSERDLSALARGARHDWMLTLSDRVTLDAATLSGLLGLLREHEDVASVACVLLGEKRVRKQTVVQTATGGLFPAAVSFASSPRLSFFEPDVLEALPNLTYSVVANAMLCSVWRTRALAELPPISGPVSENARDIRLGLDLMSAGYRNLCTTRVQASLAGAHTRRDVIDPMGSLYLRPAQWEEILGRVTVLRELH